MDFANREFKQLMGTKVPIHLLDENKSTICGIRVDLHNYITDERTRNEILQKLEKIRINMKFVRPMTPEFLERKYILSWLYFFVVFLLVNCSLNQL